MANVTFKNMFSYDGENGDGCPISVPDDSAQIVAALRNIYNNIPNYFINENNTIDKLYNAIGAISHLHSTSLRSYQGNTIYNTINSITEKQVNNFLISKGISTEDECYDIISHILYYIFIFTVFKFENAGILVPSFNKMSDDFYEIGGYIDGDLEKPYYRFKSNNRIFDLLNKITDSNWQKWTVICDPRGLGNKETTGIGLKKILEDGYYINSKNNKTYYLFEQKREIYSFLCYLIENQTVFNIDSRDFFELKISEGIITIWAEKIEEILSKFIEQKETGGYGYFEYNFGDESTPIKILIPADGDNKEALEKYHEIYEYSIGVFKKYVEKLESKEDDIRKDDGIITLFEKIVGTKADERKTNSDSTKSGLYDEKGFIEFISSLFSSYSDTTSVLSNVSSSSKSGTNINFKSPKNSINGEYTLKYKTAEIGEIFKKPEYLPNVEFKNKLKIKSLKIDSPIQFYELCVNYNDIALSSDTIENLTNKIEKISYIGGNIISKIVFFGFYKLNKSESSEMSANGSSNQVGTTWIEEYSFPTYKISQKFYNDPAIYINNELFKDYESAYTKAVTLIFDYLTALCVRQNKLNISEKTRTEEIKNAGTFNEYISSRMANNNYFTEKDFFYLNDGNGKYKAPVNTFVDIEFKIRTKITDEKTGKVEETYSWIPVTAMRNNVSRENIGVNFEINGINDIKELHAGDYFDSLELNDEAGTKKITLTLKSVNDINLENIIFSSLSTEQDTIDINTNQDLLDYIDDLLKDGESNFRVRFGYRDKASLIDGDDSTITSLDAFDKEFVERTKIVSTKSGKKIIKPVQIYPWTYFKITGIKSNIKDGEDTYTIDGLSTGSYAFDNLALCGTQLNFSGTNRNNDPDDSSITSSKYYGKPRNVIGKLAKWIAQASCPEANKTGSKDLSDARIVFLGDEPGTIITGYDLDSEKILTDYRYNLRSGETFSGGNLESVENSFFDSNKLIEAKNFSIENNYKSLSLREIITRLAEWLPDRIYYIAKTPDGRTAAINISYNSIYDIGDFFNKYPSKSEKITYQIMEADAYIYKNHREVAPGRVIRTNNVGLRDNGKNSDLFHKVYFIRMYYKGPGLTTSEDKNMTNNTYLRVYNYRSVQNQVIENIEISDNDAELGNLFSSVTLLGTGKPVIFVYNRGSATMSETSYNQQNKEEYNISQETRNTREYGSDGNINPYFSINNSKYISLEDFDENNNESSILSNKEQAASQFFTSQQNKEYTGEITMMGDPFYYFDSSLEAGKYEIYLQMNRVADRKYSKTDSKYTGIYFITGIKHNIDNAGKYTTTLSVAKRIFGVSTKAEKEKVDKTKE